jgi:hypothetical protein
MVCEQLGNWIWKGKHIGRNWKVTNSIFADKKYCSVWNVLEKVPWQQWKTSLIEWEFPSDSTTHMAKI